MKIRVLQVIGSLRMGGAEKVALSYYKYIDKNKFEFNYLVYGEEIGELEKEVLQLGGKIIRIPSPKKGVLQFIKNIRKILKKYGPYDVVHSHTLFNSGFVMIVAYIEKIPKRISHAHSARFNKKVSIIKKIYIKLMKYSIHKYSTHFIACSKDAGNYLFGKQWFSQKGLVIKNGLNIQKYIFNKEIRNKIREELNLDGKFVIGHIGRLCDVKNQEFILDIFNEVKKKHVNSLLLLVGDGNIKNELIAKAKKLELYKDVLFLGSRNDVNQLLQGMDVFLFPSKYEGLGIVLIESQLAGLRCVVSDSIPKEVGITNLVDRISLSENATIWATQILKYINKYNRNDVIKDRFTNDYNIKHTIEIITNLYA